ncbi:Ldh family oxidoreductase [Chitinophaga sedimenti]|nr:Ldh family oxidoreductase [Chitinophaga sedimenti]MCK7557379.1 Ldh family oxidoreductase [Chitinophaga sedimenti]
MGCSQAHADLASEVLVSADLRGVDSHGVARLSGYIRLWEAGRINPTPNIRIVHETPSTAVVDGDGGLGLVVAPFAMQVAIDKARNVGSGWVSVKHSNHFGIAGYHAMKALEHDMIGMAMTNASPLVAPTFAKERMLGTNPIAVAIPAGEQPPSWPTLLQRPQPTVNWKFSSAKIRRRQPAGCRTRKEIHPLIRTS